MALSLATLVLALLVFDARGVLLAPTATHSSRVPQNIPNGGKVAILFRGEVFHGHSMKPGCVTSEPCYSWSMGAIKSIRPKLVEPLEQRGNTVKMFFAECSSTKPCEKTRDMINELNSGHGIGIAAQETFISDTQGDCMSKSLMWFEDISGGSDKYDLVVVTRPDLGFSMQIDEWPTANFAGFNFYGGCEDGAFSHDWGANGPAACINDLLQVMPGEYFPKWSSIVGTGYCFHFVPNDVHGGNARTHGHWCYNATVEAMGSENVFFATDFQPPGNVRQAYDVGKLVTC